MTELDALHREYARFNPDQRVKQDRGKLRPSTCPPQIILDVALVREESRGKYPDEDSWQQASVLQYREAFFRHVLPMFRDIMAINPDSGLPHYKHAATNLAFICEMLKEDVDDVHT